MSTLPVIGVYQCGPGVEARQVERGTMTTQEQASGEDLASVPEVALAKGWSYRRAYDGVLQGLFGRPIRRDGRLFVSRAFVDARNGAEQGERRRP
jgi:hypothetical protein